MLLLLVLCMSSTRFFRTDGLRLEVCLCGVRMSVFLVVSYICKLPSMRLKTDIRVICVYNHHLPCPEPVSEQVHDDYSSDSSSSSFFLSSATFLAAYSPNSFSKCSKRNRVNARPPLSVRSRSWSTHPN